MTPIPVPCPHCGAVLKIRDPQMMGRKAKCPKCAQIFRMEAPVTAATAVAANAASATESVSDSPASFNFGAPPATPEISPPSAWPSDGAPASVAEQLKAQRRLKRKRLLISTLISVTVLSLCGYGTYYAIQRIPAKLPLDVVDAQVGDNVDEVDGDQGGGGEPSGDKQAAVEPIKLIYIPAGTRIVINLRPAELWQPGSQGEEFRFCLGPMTEFLGAKIKELSKREPDQIAEALFCIIPNERGTAPDVAAVFHLQNEAKKSQLLDDFGGSRKEVDGVPYYLGSERAWLFPDLKTIVSCPAPLAEEMVMAIQNESPTLPGLLALLDVTDRARPVTVVFEPVAAQIDADFLMPPGAIPLLEQFIWWLGDEVEAAAWSVKFEKESFRSEIVVRDKGGLDSRILAKDLAQRLEKLAGDVLHVVQQMNPKEVGKRKIIGRVPAMTRAFTLATRTEPGPRTVKLVTKLPERAAPNLALGTLLAWDESTRTILKSKSGSADPDNDKPDNTPIADKLKRKVTVEFNREPLQNAFAYIANEIKAKLEVDGDGLKLSAYTKNMPQSFAMENVPATQALWEILKKYDKMCMVVDEKKNSLLITTYPVAEQKGLKPYEFPK